MLSSPEGRSPRSAWYEQRTVGSKPAVLFVDDDAALLEGVRLTQRARYTAFTAESGAEGLRVLEADATIAAVVADLNMPRMDGTQFLREVRKLYPDATRILLTGLADVERAAEAVNEGQIFRFLTKPCSPERLSLTLDAAIEFNALRTAERVLLQQTLIGSVRAVVNTLGIASPMTLGRTLRIVERARRMAMLVAPAKRWHLELAATCSQLAAASLPDETLTKLYDGAGLAESEENALLDTITSISKTIDRIPRLDPVARILRELVFLVRARDSGTVRLVPKSTAARLLFAVVDLESLEARGESFDQALATLWQRESLYGREVLDEIGRVDAPSQEGDATRCSIRELTQGMVLAEDLRTTDGLLLLPRGFALTRSTKSHIVDRFQSSLPTQVRVEMSADAHASRRSKDVAE